MQRSVSVLLLVICLLACSSAGVAQSMALEPATEFTTSVAGPQAVALGDIDKDLALDAVVVGGGTSAWYAGYRGTGTGSFADEIAKGYLSVSPSDVVVGDFNNDGRLDIAGLNVGCG
jgi:hypothetical protein